MLRGKWLLLMGGGWVGEEGGGGVKAWARYSKCE